LGDNKSVWKMVFEELVTVAVEGIKAILTDRLCTITVPGLLFSDSLTWKSGLKSGHLSPVNERGAVRISVIMSMREKYLNISSSFSISAIEQYTHVLKKRKDHVLKFITTLYFMQVKIII